ncbi:vWA domain-containing protein [Diplocloster agilis]|uniref:vWA domain-containing protein n=1 Tax=Diplocloster agilis TaxID=2850323 RepID=UPI000821BC9C|nr:MULTISPECIES: VWA domain-containing protein [Lachnospiraceae]MBU9744166.1 VWA domain-containing protein [Diplocloster agilis]MCU6735493.1 VWA domain-containing protein [Suonthocola fibrivorans]SCJ75160.1 Mg-chelatase subunit ChlD [uncultured Clostridium sp.]
MKKNKGIVIIAAVGILVFAAVLGGLFLTRNLGKSSSAISQESADKKLEKMVKKIEAKEVPARKEAVELSTTSLQDELPDIKTYPLTVQPATDLYVEIMSSPEKAGDGTDGWFNEVAQKFNQQGYEVNGQPVSVAIRNVSSGTAVEYISSGKYVPDAISPSNTFWGEMIKAEGVPVEMLTDRLAGNVAGVLLKEDKYNALMDKYGAINMKTITQATIDAEIIMGYTNPFASSAGLNFLVNTLYTYDNNNILSDAAVEGFNSFQTNIPFVSYTTMQMRDAAESGALDGFILEYQSYANLPDLKREYIFTPFGVRHDEPLYAVGTLSEDKKQLLNMFKDFCLTDENQKLASEYGFNNLDEYVSETPEFDGDTLIKAQKLWKENKDVGTPIVAVFVIDISGSMDGAPLNMLKESMINSMQYIKSDHYVGMVSYNNDVYVNLPVGQFDLNQQAYFKGAISDLIATGGTATFDGIAVGVDMLEKALTEHPDAKPMLFVLSDGDSNTGYNLNDVRDILETYAIPVYTIGYNADIAALEKISSINEAASINAETEDVIYKLKNLFNAQM